MFMRMKMKKDTNDGTFAIAQIHVPIDILSEIQEFFPIPKQNIKGKYAYLTVKVREINEGQKEIIYDGKSQFSRIVDIHEEYSREAVIFFTYVLLHVQYDWFPFDDKPKEVEKSNLKEFCHDFFTKARDYTHKGDRDAFQAKRLFEMFLFCSVKNEVEYDLPPYEELWRVFLQDKHLMPSSYRLLFYHEENSIRKYAIAEKAFADVADFAYLRLMLADLFSKKQYRESVDLFILHESTIYDGPFPYQSELYFNFVDSCRALSDFKTLDAHIWENDAVHFGGRYGKEYIQGISAFYQAKYSDAEVDFKRAIVNDNEGNEVTRSAVVFYILSLLKQGKSDLAKSHIFDLKPREPYLDDYRIDALGYEIAIQATIEALKGLGLAKNEQDALSFFEASFIYDSQTRNKSNAKKMLELLKPLENEYAGSTAYYFLMSEVAYALGLFDESYEHKLRAIELQPKEESVSYAVEIKDTSDDFQEKIIYTLEEVYRYSRKRGFTGFIESEASYVIDYFWNEKKYYLLAELFDLIEKRGHVDDLTEYLFEFAYALKEAGSIGRSLEYYEYSIKKNGENSAVLNNLALIQEEMGKLDQAKSLIEKAFQITNGKDPIINRNRERMAKENSKSKPDGQQKKGLKEAYDTELLTYDANYGKLVYDGKSQRVRASKLMPAVLEVLFRRPQASYEAVAVFQQLNLDELSSGRSLLDCIRKINEKIKKLGLKDEVFAYRSDKIFTEEKYLKRLRFKLTEVESK